MNSLLKMTANKTITPIKTTQSLIALYCGSRGDCTSAMRALHDMMTRVMAIDIFGPRYGTVPYYTPIPSPQRRNHRTIIILTYIIISRQIMAAALPPSVPAFRALKLGVVDCTFEIKSFDTESFLGVLLIRHLHLTG